MSDHIESHEAGALAPPGQAGKAAPMVRVLRNSLQLLGGSGVAALLALVVTAYSARVLGAADFGLLAILSGGATFLSRFFGVQSGSAVVRFGAVLQLDGREAELRDLVRYSWRLEANASLAVGSAALLLLVLMPTGRAHLAGLWPLVIAYAVAIATNWSNSTSGILRLADQFRVLSVQPVVTNGTRLLGLAIAHQAGDSLLAIGLAWAAGDLVGNAYFAVCALRSGAASAEMRLAGSTDQRKHRNEVPRFVLVATIHASVKSGLREADVLLVGWILGKEGAGGYRIAKQAGGSLLKLVDPLMQSSFPEMARSISRSADREVRQLVTRIALLAIAVTLPLASVFWLLGDWLVATLLGEQFNFALQAINVYLVGSVIAAAGIALQPAALTLGLQSASLKILAACVVIYLALLLWLTATFGLSGSSMAFVGFYGLWSVAMWWIVLDRTAGDRST